jgi:hypothetical protein
VLRHLRGDGQLGNGVASAFWEFAFSCTIQQRREMTLKYYRRDRREPSGRGGFFSRTLPYHDTTSTVRRLSVLSSVEH